MYMSTCKMLDFCAKKNISKTIKVVHPNKLNIAMDRLGNSDVNYKFVICKLVKGLGSTNS